MTHGEAWLKRKLYINSSKCRFDEAEKEQPLPKRMNRREASRYYRKKLNTAFASLGFIKEPTVRDFNSVDDYFDYWEAKRIKQRVLNGC